MLTGLRDFKDILNSRQNRSKNKLVRENAEHKYMEFARSGYGLLIEVLIKIRFAFTVFY